MSDAGEGKKTIDGDLRWLLGPAVSLGLYALGFTLGLFLIPLQVVFERYRDNRRLFAGAIVLAGVLLLQLIRSGSGSTSLGYLPVWEGLAVLAMLGIQNFAIGMPQDRKVFLEFAAAAAVSSPVLWFIRDNEEFRLLLSQMGEFLFGIAGAGSEEFVSLLLVSFERTLGLGVFAAGFVTIFLGKLFGSKQFRSAWTRKAAEFRVATTPWLWVFIAGWAGVLVDLRFEIGVFGVIFWNLALASAMLYAFQGFGIIQSWMLRRSRAKASPLGLLILSLLVPGINGLVTIGLPLLGVSETWVHYKSRRKEIENNEGNS